MFEQTCNDHLYTLPVPGL